jgi:hypothetical protein
VSQIANSGCLEGIYRIDSIMMKILSYSIKEGTGTS